MRCLTLRGLTLKISRGTWFWLSRNHWRLTFSILGWALMCLARANSNDSFDESRHIPRLWKGEANVGWADNRQKCSWFESVPSFWETIVIFRSTYFFPRILIAWLYCYQVHHLGLGIPGVQLGRCRRIFRGFGCWMVGGSTDPPWFQSFLGEYTVMGDCNM